MISVPEDGVFLAPTYDHASSLGRNETDERRETMLRTRDKGQSVEAYVRRARSKMYSSSNRSEKMLSTSDAFFKAASISPEGAKYWINKLDALSEKDFNQILGQIPDQLMTQLAREFAKAMLTHNKQRLLDQFYSMEAKT